MFQYLSRPPRDCTSFAAKVSNESPIAGAYLNDFASWIATQVRDQVLAERLAVVDPHHFASVEELREEHRELGRGVRVPDPV